jgi:protocatechuate 3,4-dioxygenase beta subunit
LCNPTNAVATVNYPGARAVHPSNNLILPAGKAVEAEGQKLIITGRVLDSQCKPVPEAVVELWQNSPFGRWLLAGDDDLATSRPVFTGAGRTYTDIDGSFTFITAFPAPLNYSERKGKQVISWRRAPFVNVKIKAEGMPDLTTALFFSDDKRNDSDTLYRKLSVSSRHEVTIRMQPSENDNALQGEIDLVLPAKAPYRTY